MFPPPMGTATSVRESVAPLTLMVPPLIATPTARRLHPAAETESTGPRGMRTRVVNVDGPTTDGTAGCTIAAGSGSRAMAAGVARGANAAAIDDAARTGVELDVRAGLCAAAAGAAAARMAVAINTKRCTGLPFAESVPQTPAYDWLRSLRAVRCTALLRHCPALSTGTERQSRSASAARLASFLRFIRERRSSNPLGLTREDFTHQSDV
jgi:hypothetical protein